VAAGVGLTTARAACAAAFFVGWHPFPFWAYDQFAVDGDFQDFFLGRDADLSTAVAGLRRERAEKVHAVRRPSKLDLVLGEADVFDLNQAEGVGACGNGRRERHAR